MLINASQSQSNMRCGMGWIGLLLVSLWCSAQISDAAGHNQVNYVFMESRNAKTNQSIQLCANVDTSQFRIAKSKEKARWISLINMTNHGLDPSDLCTGVEESLQHYLKGKMPIARNGAQPTCSTDNNPLTVDTLRSSVAAECNASGVMVVTKDELLWAVYAPWVNRSAPSTVPVFAISKSTYRKLKDLTPMHRDRWENLLEVRFYRPKHSLMDWTFVIIWLIAVMTVAVGSWWSGKTKRLMYEKSLQIPSATRHGHVPSAVDSSVPSALTQDAYKNVPEPPAAPFNCVSVVSFLAVIVTMLMLMYFFPKVMVWFVIVVFAIASSFALFDCFCYLLGFLPYCTCKLPMSLAECFTAVFKRPFCISSCGRERLEVRHIFLYLGCAIVSLLWFLYRHESFEYILRDILGVAFCMNLIVQMRLPSLKWITVLLSAILVYDVFFVFITPFFTKGRCSIMIDAATGGACSSNHDYEGPSGPPTKDLEEIPVVFKVPRIGDPIYSCFDLSVDLEYPSAMLGFGDIIIPGILVAFCAGFDQIWRIRFNLYWLVSAVGYAVGMIVTFVVLMVMEEGQPALLYLVPCTLIPVHLVALCKGQWKLLWAGEYPPNPEMVEVKTEEEDENIPDDNGHTGKALGDDCQSTDLTATNSDAKLLLPGGEDECPPPQPPPKF